MCARALPHTPLVTLVTPFSELHQVRLGTRICRLRRIWRVEINVVFVVHLRRRVCTGLGLGLGLG